MKAQDDLERQVRRAITEEVDSVRLKSVEIAEPTASTTVGLVPSFAWIVAAIVLAVVVGAIWRQGQDARQPVAAPSTSVNPASASVIASPTSLASSVATPTASALPGCGAVEVGEISVCPGAGPVGTVVRIEGRNCADAGADVHLVLVGNPGETEGTIGSYSFPATKPDASGRFSLEFVVPEMLADVHGEGGGPTRPGTYRIISKPLYCGAKLTVTRT